MKINSHNKAGSRRLVALLCLTGLLVSLSACGPDEVNNDTTDQGTQDMTSDTTPDMVVPEDMADMADMSDDMEADLGEDMPDEVDMPDMDTEPDMVDMADMSDMVDMTDMTDMVDEGPDCTVDSDYDGINDCEEALIGTDPNKPDTDGDTLTDYEEFMAGTDPLASDSDGDGLSDDEELRYGFDPNNPSTLDNMVLDGDLFIASACDTAESEPIVYFEDTDGDWRLALPPVFNNYARLTIPSATPPVAAAVYDDPVNEVAAFVLSTPKGGLDPVQELVSYKAVIEQVSNITQDFTSGEFRTHDNFAAAPGQYRISATGKTVRKLRDDLLFAMAPFTTSDVTGGLPSSAGNPHNTFVLDVSVIEREDRIMTLVALAPTDLYETRDSVQFRMSDLTNTTSIARSNSGDRLKCHPFPITTEIPTADFYWVLDQSGSMYSYNNVIISFSSNFVSEVANTGLDYRLGVTNMSPLIEGKLRPTIGWHTSPQVFANEIDYYVINCDDNEPDCSGFEEFGLYAAESGITYMRRTTTPRAEKIRDDAQLVTIFMTDEQANSFETSFSTGGIQGRPNGVGATTEAALMAEYNTFFAAQTIAYAIYSDTNNCGLTIADAYAEVALQTGGASASLCAADLTQTITTIISDTAGRASSFRLPDTPVSSTLRVYQGSDDGQTGIWVPRSRTDGFDYFPQRNAIAFFGTYRPRAASKTACMMDSQCPDTVTEQCRGGTCELRNPLQVAVHYQTFINKPKNSSADDMNP